MDNVQIPQELERAWKNTCKVLLSTEVGDLLEFKNYLKRYTDQIEQRKSSLSGKGVTISSNRVPKESRVIAHEEMQTYENKMASLPFSINDIKDIDSLIGAAQERTYYTGNVVLGNSNQALDCHRCVDLHYALGCQDVHKGKFVAFTTSIHSPEYSFGCCFGSATQFCIKILDPYRTTRCLELFHANVATDCYYSASIEDCTNCMFTFNQRARNYMIGNVQLPKDSYTQLKEKLVVEIADEFKRKKALPSIIDIIRADTKG